MEVSQSGESSSSYNAMAKEMSDDPEMIIYKIINLFL